MEQLASLVGWMRSREHGPRKKRRKAPLGRRRKIVLATITAAVIALFLIGLAAEFWTDLLWFQELGYESVFWTRIWAWLAVAAVGGAGFIVLFFTNLYLARRLSPRIRVLGKVNDEEIVELVPVNDRTVIGILIAVSAFIGLLFALAAGNSWREVLLFLERAEFGYADPLFGYDASFFVFTIPVISKVLTFLWATLVLTLIGTGLVYVLDRAVSIDPEERTLKLAPHVKGHMSVLAAFALVLIAAGYIVDAWRLDFSPRGVVFGASYTDVHAQLPVYYILSGVALIAAVIFLVNIYYRGWRLPGIAVGLLAVVWIAAGQIYPAIVQQYQVSPNEIQLEAPYIEDNIEATRYAFGLDRVTTREFPAEENLDREAIAQNEATIENVRLWDPRPLLDVYSQLQELRIYYAFNDVDVDRYVIDGNYREVMLSAREMAQNQLQPQAQTWVNQHLTYTHGYGAVVSPVNEVRGEGLPIFLVGNIPPETTTDLEITRPEIYYGEVGNEFVLVNTDAQEFDYPSGNQNVYTSYEGRGGVAITSAARRAAFAIRFGTLKLLVSEYLTPDSRIMFRRTIQERVPEIAPFLNYDRDPYLIIREDGSLAWIWDAYTSSTNFPYSEPRSNGLNYIRNSVKVVVDAFQGDVTFYQMDEDDAVVNTWARIYDELFTPGSEMPDDIRRHLRYPEDLFAIQANVLSVYHMEDPQVFYNKEDVWQIPTEVYAGEVDIPVLPYYVIMGIPGEREEEFILLQPFAPAGEDRDNMIAWMAGRADGDNYGELLVFEFPKDKLVFGPAQIESRISNDPLIAEQITLWDQAGSRVIRGNLLVIPIEDSLIYVEPLYLQAEQSPIPELRRVIVAYGDRVVMARDLEDALTELFDREGEEPEVPPTVSPLPPPEAGETTTTLPEVTTTTTLPEVTTTTTVPPAGPLPDDAAALISLAQEHFEAAQEAQRQGDWAEYGRRVEELGRVLERLQSLGG
ncbi:MAG: UPF0182 family protein [Thermoleophilia bacterium]